MAQTLPIKLRTIAAAVVVIASGLIIFNVYQTIINSSEETPQALPIIKAESEPFRVAPENPGGAEIPNQGSTLFNVLNDNNADRLALDGIRLKPIEGESAEPETIFDAPPPTAPIVGFALPEVPETRTESLYGMIDELEGNIKPAPTRDLKDAEVVVEKEVVVLEPTPEPVAVVASTTIKPSKKPTPPSKKLMEPKTFSLERVLDAVTISKKYYIQLASLKGEDNARKAYETIRNNFPKLVAGVGVFYPSADLGARGIFTRIQIGPFDQLEAKSRCADYTSSSRGGTCLVISR
jgi:cell division septation protein DedD